MKIILIIVAVMTISSFASAQEMKGMEMSKKEKTVPITKKKTVLQMPNDTSKNKKMDGMDMPKSKEKIIDDMRNMNMSNPASVKDKGKQVAYYLDVTDTLVTFANGKLKPAIAINGTIPAPTLYFTEGDTATIYVRNLMKVETSIHWHGVLVPNVEDGVPYLTTAAIIPGSTYKFTFPIIQNGTYWYHSHSGLQEQVGLYGAIVIYQKTKSFKKKR